MKLRITSPTAATDAQPLHYRISTQIQSVAIAKQADAIDFIKALPVDTEFEVFWYDEYGLKYNVEVLDA